MKRVFFLILITTCTVNLSKAQKYSIEARFMPGYHRSTGEKAISDERFQNNGGLFLKRSLNDRFGFITGVNTRILNHHRKDDIYNHKGEFLFNYDQQIRYNYLELPINCYYNYKNFFVEGGLNFNYLMSFYGKIDGQIITSKKQENMTFLPGVNINIGYELPIGKQFYANIGAFYDYPIFFEYFFKSTLMNYGLYVGFGYKIPQKIKE